MRTRWLESPKADTLVKHMGLQEHFWGKVKKLGSKFDKSLNFFIPSTQFNSQS